MPLKGSKANTKKQIVLSNITVKDCIRQDKVTSL